MPAPSPEPAERPAVNRWLIAISVMAGTFMVVLDTTVVNVSLPHIAGSLSATTDEATWALTSYLTANAVILPMTGWLANFFGRKRLLMAAVGGFTLASSLCGLAPTLPILIFFRIVQGLTGGVMQPLSQAVLLEAFPPHERGKAMGFWGLGIVVAPIVGPVLGGWLTADYSWRWIFYINIPVGLAALVMMQLFIFDPSYIRRGTARIDYWGIGLLAVGFGTLQVALDTGQERDWLSSHLIVALLVISAVAITWMVVHELRARDPVVDLHVFTNRTYTFGVILVFLVGFVLYGSLVLLPLLLQTLMGYSALEAGIALAPRGLGAFIAMPLVGAIMSRVDPRKLLLSGVAMAAFTLYWLSWLNLDAGYWDLFWPQFVQGMALGLLFVPLTTITMDPVPNAKMGNATSLYNLTRNIGSSMGIALAQTLVARHLQIHTNILGARINRYDTVPTLLFERLKAGFMARGSDAVTAGHQALAAMAGMVRRQAALLSYLDAFRWLGALTLVILPLVFLMRRPRHKADEPVAIE